MTVIILAAVVAAGLPLITALIAWLSRVGRYRQRLPVTSASAEERFSARGAGRERRVVLLLPVAGLAVVVLLLFLAASGIGQPMGMGGNMDQMMRGMMGSGANASTSGSASGSGEIRIENFSFQSSQMTVTVGTVIRWTNQDTAPHTVTARDGSFDSGRLDKGQSFEHRFDEPGSIDYFCAYHPGMTGRITVTDASQ